jgi:MATE family multidrug resistance protein
MVGWIGYAEQAAHQIAISIAACTYMIASGIASAASVRVGNFYGIKNYKELRRAGFSALFMGGVFMLISAIIFILLHQSIPVFFSNDVNVVSIASSLLLIAAVFQLADGTQAIALGILRGAEDVKIPTIITLVAYWLVALPSSYVLAFMFNMGINGIWYGLMIGLFVVSVSAILRFNRMSRFPL